MIGDVRKYYNCIASSFENAYFAETIHCEGLKTDMLADLKAISVNLEELDTCSVLDLGCGTGYWSRYFFKHPDIEVTGVDISDNMGEVFQKNLPVAKFICEDIFNFIHSNDSEYDSILCSFVLSHYDLQYAMHLLKYAQRRLKPGGYIVLTDSSWSPLRQQFANKEIYKTSFGGRTKKYYRTKSEFEGIIEGCGLKVVHSYFGAAFFNYIVSPRNGI